MQKILKLILIAAVLVGAVVGLMYVIAPSNGVEGSEDIKTQAAKDWKKQIDDMCKPGKWTETEFNRIQTGIHSDRVTSKGVLISMAEEAALQKYLFTSSCAYLNNQVDVLFKQTSYPAGTIKASEDMLTFLTARLDSFGANSNLAEASNLLSEYHQLIGVVTLSSNASYSHPLRAFSAMSADAAVSKVKSLKHYSSHFSKNPTIKGMVDNYASNRAKAERAYYDNLERAIERHAMSTKDINVLLDDEIRFKQIAKSSNPGAVNKLENFVNNPNKW